MHILKDSRQQAKKHTLKDEWFAAHGVTQTVCKQAVGDYSLPPKLAVDTKRNMSEIAANICSTTKEHERFRRECLLAQELGTRLIILVENTEGIKHISQVPYWENPRRKQHPGAVTGKRLYKAMVTMQKEYDVRFLFCDPTEAAEYIVELLKRGEERTRDDD